MVLAGEQRSGAPASASVMRGRVLLNMINHSEARSPPRRAIPRTADRNSVGTAPNVTVEYLSPEESGEADRLEMVLIGLLEGALIAAALGLGWLLRERRHRLGALQTMETRYRRLFDTTPSAIAIGSALRDQNGRLTDVRFVAVNPAMERLLKRPSSEIIGLTVRTIWPDGFLTGERLLEMEEALRSHLPVIREWYSRSLQRRLRASVFEIGDDLYVAAMEDITAAVQLDRLLRVQLRVANAALARSDPAEFGRILEEELKSFEELDAGGLYLYNVESQTFDLVHYWGVSARFVAGVVSLPADSVAGRRFRQGQRIILNPGPERDATIEGPLYTEEKLQAIASFPLMEGSDCHGCITLTSRTLPEFSEGLLDLLGALARQIAVAISSSRTHSQLVESEENFRRMAENIGDALIICSPKGETLYANTRATRLLAVPAEQMSRIHCTDWLSPETAAALQRQFNENRFQQPAALEGWLRPFNMAPVPVDIVATTTRWHHLPAVMFSLRDLSLRRQMESEIARVALEERARLGRELHDGVAQDLAASALLLSGAVLEDESQRESRLTEVRNLIQQSLQRIRKMIHGLESLEAVEGRLTDALGNLATQVSNDFGIACRLEADAQALADNPNVNSHLFYIAREAVMNAVRHGRPESIVIRLKHCTGNGLRLEVQDDGAGFDPTITATKGKGLRVMRYRAERIGAAFEIRAREPRGMMVAVELPPRNLEAPGRAA